MIRKNAIANYTSQLYIAIVGIFIVPYYIQALGPDGYGLVAFFSMLQGFMSMLDIGLSSSLSREASKARCGELEIVDFWKYQSVVSLIFCVIAMFVYLFGTLSATAITETWLDTPIEGSVVLTSFHCMLLAIIFRWFSGPFKSSLIGFGRQVSVNVINIAYCTARFPLSLFILFYAKNDLEVFFIYQSIVSFCEFFTFFFCSKLSIFSGLKREKITRNYVAKVIPKLKFALSIACTSIIWVLVTQLDKLLLSGKVELASYGYFSMAVIVAGGINLLGTPLFQAIMPKMVEYATKGNYSDLTIVYLRSTEVLSFIVLPISSFVAFFSYQVVYIWSGSSSVADEVSKILIWYALGNGFLALSSFTYYLQHSFGSLKYHIYGNLVLIVILLPSLIFAINRYGALGAAVTWFLQNAIYFFIFTLFIHRKLLPKLHSRWLSSILVYVVPTFLILSCYSFFILPKFGGEVDYIHIIILLFLTFFVNGIFLFRDKVLSWFLT